MVSCLKESDMPNNKDLLCGVTDNRRPYPRRQGGEYVEVYSVQQLVQLLHAFAGRAPGDVIVSRPNGPLLFVGIGGDLAAVTAYPYPGVPMKKQLSWTARANKLYATENRNFVSEGEPVTYRIEDLMPVEEVIDIVVQAMELGQLSDTHDWVNPQGERFRLGQKGDASIFLAGYNMLAELIEKLMASDLQVAHEAETAIRSLGPHDHALRAETGRDA